VYLVSFAFELTYAGFWYGNLKGRGHFTDMGVGGRIIKKCILKK